MMSLQRLDLQQVSHDTSKSMLRNNVVHFPFALEFLILSVLFDVLPPSQDRVKITAMFRFTIS